MELALLTGRIWESEHSGVKVKTIILHLDRMIRAIAESRVLYLSRETGRPITDNWVGQVLGQHRRSLSAAFVRAQAACLTSRMGHLGVGAREAAIHPGFARCNYRTSHSTALLD